jgi:hypothetical protein
MADTKMDQTFKIGGTKVGKGSTPIDAGIDIPIIISESKVGADKNKNKDIRLNFSQIGEVGKTASVYLGFKFDDGYQQYINFLFNGNVLKKAGIDPNSQPTAKKIKASLDKGAKALAGVKFLADIAHKDDKYQGKPIVRAEILNVRPYKTDDPVVTTDSESSFEGFDEATPNENNENTENNEEVTNEEENKDEFLEE